MTYLRNLVAMICYFILAASAQAYEAGFPAFAQKPGLTLGGWIGGGFRHPAYTCSINLLLTRHRFMDRELP